MQIDVTRKCKPAGPLIGLVTGLETSASSTTGFQIKMLLRGVERTLDAVRAVYDLRFSDQYFPYPCLGEMLFLAVGDAAGVVTGLVDVNDILAEKNPIKTGFVMGTYKMFEFKITEETPRVGDILEIKGNTVTSTDFDRCASAGAIRHCVYRGTIPPPADGVSFKLAADVDLYTWDWTTALAPFSRCSREEAKARRFVTRASVGSLEDLKKNCYWVGFYSTRGNNDECDLVKCFLNAPPGWK